MPDDAELIVCPFCGMAYDLVELRRLALDDDGEGLGRWLDRMRKAPMNAPESLPTAPPSSPSAG